MTRRHDKGAPMPSKDPQNWQGLLNMLPHFMAAFLTFCVAFVRGVHDGGPWKKAFLGALVCTLLAVALYPAFAWVASSRGWPVETAFAPCVFLGFLGTEWIRNKADDIYDILTARLRK